MKIEYLQFGLWTLAVVFQTSAGVYILRQKRHREFPVFFSYTVFQVLRSLALFLVLQLHTRGTASYASYFDLYWITDVVSVGLSLFLIFESSRGFLKDYQLASKIVSVSLVIVAVGLLLCDILLIGKVPGHESHRLIAMILLLDRSIAVLQTGLVLVLFVSSRILAISWRTSLPFGVCLGFGLIGLVNLVSATVRAQFGTTANLVYDLARMFTYVLAALIWLVYISPSRKIETAINARDLSDQTENWKGLLTELVHQ